MFLNVPLKTRPRLARDAASFSNFRTNAVALTSVASLALWLIGSKITSHLDEKSKPPRCNNPPQNSKARHLLKCDKLDRNDVNNCFSPLFFVKLRCKWN